MKKKAPSLTDYKLNKHHLNKYDEYQQKRDLRLKKIEKLNSKIDDIISTVTFIITFIVLVLIFLLINDFPSHITEEYSNQNYWTVVGLIAAVILIPLVILFSIGIFLVAILNGILFLLQIDKLIIFVYKKLNKEPQREWYFEQIDRFREAEQKHKEKLRYLKITRKKYIYNLMFANKNRRNYLEKNYPGIQYSDYKIKLYYINLFNSITDYEKFLINNMIVDEQKRKRKDYWNNLGGLEFEGEVTSLYQSIGYKAEKTKAVADGGIDIKLWDKNNNYIVVQCKRHSKPVSRNVVADLFGVMHKEKAKRAILICTGGFTKGAIDFAKELPTIELIEIGQLLEMVNKVHPFHHELVDTITNISVLNCVFKKIGGLYIPYSIREHLSEPEFCLFKTEREINQLIIRLKEQIFSFFKEYAYEISKYGSFYYLRIFKNSDSCLHNSVLYSI